jgi:hypothetical protein
MQIAGPKPGQDINRWLAVTGVMEIFCAGLFTWMLWRWKQQAWGRDIGALSVIGLASLNVVLAQGGAYWLWKRNGAFDRRPASQRLRLLHALYVFNTTLLTAVPLCWLALLLFSRSPSRTDAIVGAGFYLFAWGEFIQYFSFKINMRAREGQRMWRTGHLIPARLRRELRQAKWQVQRKRAATS